MLTGHWTRRENDIVSVLCSVATQTLYLARHHGIPANAVSIWGHRTTDYTSGVPAPRRIIADKICSRPRIQPRSVQRSFCVGFAPQKLSIRYQE
jgi:hypothetical protein